MQKAVLFFLIVVLTPLAAHSQQLNQTDVLGLKQGKWMKTYPNGKVRYTGQFRDDRPYGEFKYFYVTGELQAVTRFSDDGVVANTRTFHRNGAPMAEGKYIRQKKEGLWRYYSDVDSSLVSEENYHLGVLNGKSITYYPGTDQPTEIILYENGLKQGPYLKFFPSGDTMTKGTYVNDTLEGEFLLFHPNGQIQVEGWYEKGIQKGTWKYYDEEGNPLKEEEFKGKGSN